MTRRLPALDGLRAISILLVLGAHMLPLGPKALELNDTAGAMGMSLFFALSGFLITSALRQDSNVPAFLVRRLTRIVPLAYAYVLLVFTFVHFDPTAALWTASFTINYFTHYMRDGLNNHFWSLCVEVQFYIGIAIAVLLGGKKALWIVVPICLLVTAIRIYETQYIAIQTHLRIDEILSGATVALLFYSRTRAFRIPSYVVLLFVISWIISGHPQAGWIQYLRPYFTGMLLFTVLLQKENIISKFVGMPIFGYIAIISYALYIIHPLTTYGWFNEGNVLQRYFFKRPISFLLTFGLAHISTFYWERPWTAAGRKWIESRKLKLASLK